MTECELCGTEENLTEHHVIPQQLAGVQTKGFGQLPDSIATITICERHHNQIHENFSNLFLALELNTVPKLAAALKTELNSKSLKSTVKNEADNK